MHVTDKPGRWPCQSRGARVLARIVGRMMAKDPAARFCELRRSAAALESARAERRELSGFRTRGIALAVDAVLLAMVGYFAGCGDSCGGCIFRPFPPPVRANPGKVLLGIRVEDAAGGRIRGSGAASLPGLAWGPWLGQCWRGRLFLYRDQRVAFRLASLTLSQLALPALYVALATVSGRVPGWIPVGRLPSPTAWPCTTSWRARSLLQSTAPGRTGGRSGEIGYAYSALALARWRVRSHSCLGVWRAGRLACSVVIRGGVTQPLGPVSALPGELGVAATE